MLSREVEGGASNSAARKRRRKWGETYIKDGVKVIGGTCNGFSAKYMDAYVLDRLIIDEAGQATEPEAISPISRVQENGQIVLVGDHMQLRPYVTDRAAVYAGLGTSLLERLIMCVPGSRKCFLDTPYRMVPLYHCGRTRNSIRASFAIVCQGVEIVTWLVFHGQGSLHRCLYIAKVGKLSQRVLVLGLWSRRT